MRRMIVLPDIQAPLENKRQVNSMAAFVKHQRAEYGDKLTVAQCGDLVDFTSLGRWVRGKRGEYAGDINQIRDHTCRVIEKLGIQYWQRGNHDERLDKYVEEHAPALTGLSDLSMENLFRLRDLGVTYNRELWEFAPGWVLAHGDEGPISAIAGQTAMRLANRIGKSVVCGHGHRAGIASQTESFNGAPTRTLHGVEVGHAMEMSKAGYLKGQYANWQAAFGVLDISNSKVQPYVVFMSPTGGFTFEHVSYEDGKPRKSK